LFQREDLTLNLVKKIDSLPEKEAPDSSTACRRHGYVGIHRVHEQRIPLCCDMTGHWVAVANRVVNALDARAGELVQVRDRTGRYDVIQEITLALERLGATPVLELLPPGYVQRLLTSTDPQLLARWDKHRSIWQESVDRVLVLAGVDEDRTGDVPLRAAKEWQRAVERLSAIEARRCLPYLLVAVPTDPGAQELGMTPGDLEEIVVPSLAAPPEVLQRQIDAVLVMVQQAQTFTIHSGGDNELRLELGGRRWLSDSGRMPAPGVLAPGVQPVQNLPAGSVYTTVLEDATNGTLRLPSIHGATNVTLEFHGGRVVSVDAVSGGEWLTALLDRHDGEPRRVSHIGIGLNPHLNRSIGWTLVDEHRHGALFIALGENRYLGGENASSLNVDFAIPEGSLSVDGRLLVEEGVLKGVDSSDPESTRWK
jgi:leucyl aminopeptidase (aminopeptidase T)